MTNPEEMLDDQDVKGGPEWRVVCENIIKIKETLAAGTENPAEILFAITKQIGAIEKWERTFGETKDSDFAKRELQKTSDNFTNSLPEKGRSYQTSLVSMVDNLCAILDINAQGDMTKAIEKINDILKDRKNLTPVMRIRIKIALGR